MKNNAIRLTEEDLHILVEDAVRSYLINEGVDESLWGGLSALGGKLGNKMQSAGQKMSDKAGQMYNNAKTAVGNATNAVADKAGQMYNNAKTAVGNATNAVADKAGQMYNSAKATYQTGSAVSDAQNAIANAQNAIEKLLQADQALVNAGQNSVIGNGQQRMAINNAASILKGMSGRFAARKSAFMK